MRHNSTKEETAWPNVLMPYDAKEAMKVGDAAKRAGKSDRTIRLWCEIDGIGRKVVGSTLKVSRVALQMKLENASKALSLYRDGNRTDPTVIAYFERLKHGEFS